MKNMPELENNYTKIMEDLQWDSKNKKLPFDTPEELHEFLNKYSFRTFSEGLTTFLKKCGYSGNDDNSSKSKYLSEKLKAIKSTITTQTVRNWFNGKVIPNPDSRNRMFEICFALNASLEDTEWFFEHIYLDKAFDFHKIDEIIYYHCFKNKKTLKYAPTELYQHAKSLIGTIESYPIESDSEFVYTKDIKEHIENYTSDQEFVNYLKENKHLFSTYNNTAKKYIKDFLEEICGTETKNGYIIEHYKIIGKDLSKKSISINLMLNEILNLENIKNTSKAPKLKTYAYDGILKEADIPEVIKRWFPSRKTISDISHNKNSFYESLRKCLILLKFYCFWIKLEINSHSFDSFNSYDEFCDETNDLLNECGYAPLLPINLYDFIFLCASKKESPSKVLYYLGEFMDLVFSSGSDKVWNKKKKVENK